MALERLLHHQGTNYHACCEEDNDVGVAGFDVIEVEEHTNDEVDELDKHQGQCLGERVEAEKRVGVRAAVVDGANEDEEPVGVNWKHRQVQQAEETKSPGHEAAATTRELDDAHRCEEQDGQGEVLAQYDGRVHPQQL